MVRNLLILDLDDKRLFVIMRLKLALEFDHPIKSPVNDDSK